MLRRVKPENVLVHRLLLKEGLYKNDLSTVLRIRMHVCTVHILRMYIAAK